jgi:hypothetical protein
MSLCLPLLATLRCRYNFWHIQEAMVRLLYLLLTGVAVASCAQNPPPPTRTAMAQQRYEMLIAGKIPQAPISCLPPAGTQDMIRIDDDTIAFASGSRRVYINHMHGPCSGISNQSNALVTVQHTPPGPCSGDIARVVDSTSRITVGSCAWGDFVPYVSPSTGG